MRRWLIVVALAGLSGCANQLAERQAELSHWVGQPETTLLGRFGAPNRTYETGGMKFLTYDERHVDVVPNGPYWWGGPGPFFYPDPYPVTVFDRACDTTFTVVQGVVRAFSLRGNACG